MPKIAAGATNKNISIAPHGTGKVVVGTGAADATVQSDGDYNLILQTGNSTTSKIEITDGANGDVAVTPNGTGNLTIDNIAISDNTIISTDTNGNIAITPNGTGEVDITKVDIDGGTVDGITLGTNSAVTAAQIDNINIDGNAITSTDTNGNIDLTPAGTGEVNISKVDIDGGAIDATDVTVGAGKTLDVSAGSLTSSTEQKQAIVDGSDITSVGTVTSGTWQGTDVAVAHGGTGASALTANSVLLGNGTNTPLMIAPSTIGNVLTSNGTVWVSTPAAGGGGWQHIETITASNQATVQFDLFTSTYNNYMIKIAGNSAVLDDQQFQAQFAIDGTYLTSGYGYWLIFNASDDAVQIASNQDEVNMNLGQHLGNAAGEFGDYTLYFTRPTHVGSKPKLYWTGAASDTDGTIRSFRGAAQHNTPIPSATTVDGVRFKYGGADGSGYTVANGIFTLYGLSKS